MLRAASNPDDLDAANETDEAAAADQKALPTSSHITFITFYYIIIYLSIYIYSCHRFSPLLNWIFNRLYLSIDPISKLIYHGYCVSRLGFFHATDLTRRLKRNYNLGVSG